MEADGPASPPDQLLEFMLDYVSDLNGSRVQPVDHYQARYPELRDEIARKYSELERTRTVGVDSTLAAPVPPADLEGRDIGRFLVRRPLGRGGQGMVYEATDPTLHRQVALKVLTGLADQPAAVFGRFRREAEISSRLEHPNICPVYEASLDGQIPYIVMRLIEGETLASRIRRARTQWDQEPGPVLPLPASDAPVPATLRFFATVADALHAAHEVGVVHRDVKPGNLMAQPDGEPMILDFGLASAVESSERDITLSGDVFGTPSYMAPEQVDRTRAELGPHTDQHALAVCLFEVLTLTLPFAGPTRESLFRQILDRVPIDPVRLRPELPRDVGVVLAKALQKEPRHRYPSCRAFADDLRAVADLRPIAARPTPLLTRGVRWCRREPERARLAAFAAVWVVFALGALGYLAARLHDFRGVTLEREARARAEQVESLLEQGFFELALFKHHPALQRFEEAAAESGGASIEATIGRVIAWLRLGRADDALAVLDEDGREHRALLRCRAAVLSSLGRADDAELLFDELGEPRGELDSLVAAQWSLTTEEHARALRQLENAIFLAPQPRALYHVERLRVAIVGDDLDAARQSLDAIDTHWPEHPTALFERARYARSAGSPDEARRLILRFLEARPRNYLAWNELSMTELDLGRVEPAIDAARTSIALHEKGGTARLCMSEALISTGQLVEAIPHLEVALRDPRVDVHLANQYMAAALYRSGDLEAAYEHLKRVGPELNRHDLVLKGAILAGLDRKLEAHEAFAAAVLIDPDMIGALNGLAAMSAELGDLDTAIESFARLGEKLPGNVGIHRNYLRALLQAERWTELRAELERWIDLHPDAITQRLILARTYLGSEVLGTAVPEALWDHPVGESLVRKAESLWLEDGGTDETTGAEIEELRLLIDASGIDPGAGIR